MTDGEADNEPADTDEEVGSAVESTDGSQTKSPSTEGEAVQTAEGAATDTPEEETADGSDDNQTAIEGTADATNHASRALV